MSKQLKIGLYARVSKCDDSQDPENQLKPLREFASALEGAIIEEYVDKASGSNGDRINFLRMLEDADKRRFNLLLVWSLDRISREGIPNTLGYIKRLKNNGIAIKSLKESWLDTRDEGIGELLVAIFSWVAQQERKRLIERINAGLDRAKSNGKTLGRPLGSRDTKRRKRSGYLLRWQKTNNKVLV